VSHQHLAKSVCHAKPEILTLWPFVENVCFACLSSSLTVLVYMWGHRGPWWGKGLPEAEPVSIVRRLDSMLMTCSLLSCFCIMAQALSLSPSLRCPDGWPWASYIYSFSLYFSFLPRENAFCFLNYWTY
jgi:hypothetical protein